MGKRFPSKRQMQESAAELGQEDGSDPKDFFRKSSGRRTPRKVLQLCSQVQQALYWALGSESGEEALALFQVLNVEPAPNSSRLLVTIAVPEDMSIDTGMAKLQQFNSILRMQVALAIHRRKAPELAFTVVRMPK